MSANKTKVIKCYTHVKLREESVIKRQTNHLHNSFFIRNKSKKLLRLPPFKKAQGQSTLYLFITKKRQNPDEATIISILCCVLSCIKTISRHVAFTLKYIRLAVRDQFGRVSLKSSESIHLLSCQRRSSTLTATMVYSQFVGMSKSRTLHILHLEARLDPAIECCCTVYKWEIEFWRTDREQQTKYWG